MTDLKALGEQHSALLDEAKNAGVETELGKQKFLEAMDVAHQISEINIRTPGTYSVRWGGNSDFTISSRKARRRAMRHGIHVIGIAGAIWPRKELFYTTDVEDELIEELVNFSINARRFIEINGVAGLQARGSVWSVGPKGPLDEMPEDETNLSTILNKVVHSRDLTVMWMDRPASRFQHLGDTIIVRIHAKSDKGNEIVFCPTAAVLAFMQTEMKYPKNEA